MNASIDYLNDWSALGWDRLGTFVWQSTLLVLVVALTAKLLKRASPSVRFWLWQIVAVKLLLMPFWMVDVSLPAWLTTEQPRPQPVEITNTESPTLTQPNASSPSTSADLPLAVSPPITTNPSPTAPQIAWQTSLLFLWLAAVVLQVARIARQRMRLNRLLRQAQPAGELQSMVHKCSATLGLRSPPTTVLVDAEVSPFVCGLRQPRLVLSNSLAASATPGSLRQIVLHELAHIRRRDLLWCWIPSVLQIVYWFHPAAHWVAYRVQLERELACDQMAIQHSGSSADDYADTLIDVVSHTASRIAAQAAFSAQFVGGSKR